MIPWNKTEQTAGFTAGLVTLNIQQMKKKKTMLLLLVCSQTVWDSFWLCFGRIDLGLWSENELISYFCWPVYHKHNKTSVVLTSAFSGRQDSSKVSVHSPAGWIVVWKQLQQFEEFSLVGAELWASGGQRDQMEGGTSDQSALRSCKEDSSHLFIQNFKTNVLHKRLFPG